MWGWIQTSPKVLELAESRFLFRIRTHKRVFPVTLPSGETIHTLDTLPAGVSAPKESAPLVLTHGFGSGLALWYSNIDGLSSVGRVLALDWLGMGRSSRPNFGHKRSILPFFNQISEAENFFIDSLEAWRDSLGLENLHLLGHSFGGYLSVSYALKYPSRVKTLILVSPVGVPPLPEVSELDNKDGKRVKRSDKVAKDWTLWFFENLWRWNFTPQSLLRLSGPWGYKTMHNIIHRRFATLAKEEREDICQYLYHISVAQPSGELALNALLSATFSGPTRGIFARTPLSAADKLPALIKEQNIPVHLLFGTHDWMHTPFISEFVEKLGREPTKGKIHLHMLEGCGHHSYLDAPEKFHLLVRDIVQRN